MAVDRNSTQVMFVILHLFEARTNVFLCADTEQNFSFPLLRIILIPSSIKINSLNKPFLKFL